MNRIIKTSGGNTLREKSAAGAKGILIRSFEDDKPMYGFRIYNDDGTFDDYKLSHCDLAVRIDEDELASFYEDENGDKYLDETPETMGWEIVESEN
jgi:hypothetical protein